MRNDTIETGSTYHAQGTKMGEFLGKMTKVQSTAASKDSNDSSL